MGDWSGLLLLGLIAVPVVLLVLYLRGPYDSGSVPRDQLSMAGKGKATRALGVLPNKAFEDQMRDEATDTPDKPERPLAE